MKVENDFDFSPILRMPRSNMAANIRGMNIWRLWYQWKPPWGGAPRFEMKFFCCVWKVFTCFVVGSALLLRRQLVCNSCGRHQRPSYDSPSDSHAHQTSRMPMIQVIQRFLPNPEAYALESTQRLFLPSDNFFTNELQYECSNWKQATVLRTRTSCWHCQALELAFLHPNFCISIKQTHQCELLASLWRKSLCGLS